MFPSTSQLSCAANQLTGFYMMETLVDKVLSHIHVKLVVVDNSFPFTEATNMPRDFQGNFLKHNSKKVALNSFLAGKLITHEFGGAIVFISVKSEVQCNSTDVSKDLHNGRI